MDSLSYEGFSILYRNAIDEMGLNEDFISDEELLKQFISLKVLAESGTNKSKRIIKEKSKPKLISKEHLTELWKKFDTTEMDKKRKQDKEGMAKILNGEIYDDKETRQKKKIGELIEQIKNSKQRFDYEREKDLFMGIDESRITLKNGAVLILKHYWTLEDQIEALEKFIETWDLVTPNRGDRRNVNE